MLDYLRNLTKSADEKEQEALSAYLDDALSPTQRQRFENRLEQDEELKTQVNQVRTLKQQLRQLPQRPVPRNFMLDPAAYGRPQRQPLIQMYPALRVATVLTAFFFILAIAMDLFMVQSGDLASPASQDVAMFAEEAPAAEPEAAVVEVTRMVVETEVEVVRDVETEVVVEVQEEADSEVEDAAEAPAEEVPAGEARAEDEVGVATAAETADNIAEGEGLAATTATYADTGASEAMTPTPAPTDGSVKTGTASPTPAATPPPPAATTSTLPRPTAETEESDRAVAILPTDVDDQEAETIGAVAAEPTGLPESPESSDVSPLDGLQLLQITLGIALAILLFLTLFVRRRRFQ
jgi:anti-sigma factor RsiW